MPIRPMSERRQHWQALMDASPHWSNAYSWLRAEQVDLDRRCESSLMLRLRTHAARKRIRRGAVGVMLAAAALIDDSLPLEPAELNRRESRASEFLAARSDTERMYRARGWLMSSEAAMGGTYQCGAITGNASGGLTGLAMAVARLAGGA